MKTIKYDFSDFNNIMHRIKNDPSSSNMRALQKELNTFFKDSKCEGVIYTNNTDKLFFGMCVMPVISGRDAVDILQDDKSIRINSYYLEIDSKLFDPMLGLTSRELVSILLHEVGHIVNDTTPVDELRKEIDVYLARENETLVISDSIHYREILAYGLKDYIRRVGSLFEKKDDEILADEFVYYCGFGKDLESAFKKIVKNQKLINKDVSNKFMVLRWTLSLYKDVKHKRIAAIRLLNRGKTLDSSKLESREKENVIRRLNRIDDDSLLESSISEFKPKKGIFTNMRVKGMRALEEELFEFAIRLKTLNSEEDALVMIRQINYRISLIDEYIRTENLSEDEKNRWYDLRDDYNNVREKIVEKDIGKSKAYGLWIQYPDKER